MNFLAPSMLSRSRRLGRGLQPWSLAIAATLPPLHAQTIEPIESATPRWRQAAAYDLARSRIVMFGGSPNLGSSAGETSDTWEFTGAEWQLAKPAVSPPARLLHAMTYDVIRQRMLLFGGSANSVARNDTWAYDGQTWQQLPTANTPPPRSGHVLVHDLQRDRAVLFGGNALGDTWEFDGANWIPSTTASSPPPRMSSAGVYDLSRGRVVLFGGAWSASGVPTTYFDDTWEYAAGQWSRVLTSVSPAGRYAHAMAYDSSRARTVLFSGYSANYGDTWEYDGVTWQQIAATSASGSRMNHTLVYDAARSRTSLMGGVDTGNYAPEWLEPLWHYNGAAWTRQVLSPSLRSNAALAADARRGRCVLFGGFGQDPQYAIATLDDTWELGATSWAAVATAHTPPARDHHAMVYDSRSDRVVLFGGFGGPAVGYTALGDTWEYDGLDWSQATPATSPGPRYSHALAFDAARRRTVLFGGRAANGVTLADTWEYDGANWSLRNLPLVPPARSDHAMAYDSGRGKTVLFGGWSNGDLADTWTFDGAAWLAALPPASPPAVHGHSLAYDAMRGRVVQLGTNQSSIWEFDGATWSMTLGGFGRRGATMTFDPAYGRTVFFGGLHPLASGVQYLSGTWRWSPLPAATWARHGLGCLGSAGVPQLDRVGAAVPALGSTFPVRITSLPATPGAVYLALGFSIAQWNGTPLPIDLGSYGLTSCSLWMAPEPGAGPLLMHPGGSANWQIALPAVPALAGTRLAMQALVFDPAVANGAGAVTNAGVATLH